LPPSNAFEAITLLILGGLGYIAWTALQQKQAANRGARPDQPVPVLAATPPHSGRPRLSRRRRRVRALNTVTVRAQVDGKLISVNFTEGQDVKKDDVLGEIDPADLPSAIRPGRRTKPKDEALLANQRIDLTRYEQLAASNAGLQAAGRYPARACRAAGALIKADQAQIDNMRATLGYTKIIAPLSGRAGLRQVDQGNIIHSRRRPTRPPG